MATLPDKQYSSNFSGLQSTLYTASGFIIGGLIIKETLQRLRRYPDEDARRERGETVPDRGMEGWAMGYIYRARSYVAGPRTRDYGRYPLTWILDAYKLDEKFFEKHCGADATVYIRFLRGTLFWVFGHLCTTFPVLLSINYIYAPDDVARDSIDRASMASLVRSSGEGSHLLGVHVAFVWLVMLSWMGNLFFMGCGALRIRRNELRKLLRDEVERHQPDAPKRAEDDPIALDLDPSIPDEDVGWRYRTVLVRNIPPVLRTEEAIRDYFERYLREPPPAEADASETAVDLDPKTPTSATPLRSLGPLGKNSLEMLERKTGSPPPEKLIVDVVLVRRHVELNELYNKYGEVLHQLETAHVQLARNVMAWVEEKVAQEEAEKSGVPLPISPWDWWKSKAGRLKRKKEGDVENDAREGDDLILSALRPFVPVPPSRPLPPPPAGEYGHPLTLWEALHALHAAHPTLLDRFQPLFRLRMFHRAQVPAIDYYLAKHNLLFCLIEDKRAHAESEAASSTAFVTFAKASDARRARKQLKWRPLRAVYRGRVLDCKVKMAPEARDLHWDQVVRISLSGDLLRGTILQVLLWGVTLIWVLPISFLIGLLSLNSLKERLPAVAAFLERNPVANSLFTSLLPTAIMAVINMFVPTVIGILTRNGRTIITESKWSASTQASYWKFVAVNFITIFSIGNTAFTAFLNSFRRPTSVLDVVAKAFPQAATFFTSYVLLQAGIQTGVELSMLGISWINHGSIRKYIAPRKRAIENIPRFFGWQSWVPNALFIVSIQLIFAPLNPLVIAFGFVYFAIAVIVFKQQFSHVYYRRHFEGGGRSVFRRIFRYSLDIAILSEFVQVAFLWTARRFSLGGACIPLIPLTVAAKILGTRWFDHLMDEVEEAQIDVICGEGEKIEEELSVPLTEDDRPLHHLTVSEAFSTVKTFATVTLPALALRPAAKLPKVASPSRLAAHWKSRSEAAGKRSRVDSHTSRPRARTSPDDWDRPMLATIASREEEAVGTSPLPGQDRYGKWALASDEGHGGDRPQVEEKSAAAAPAGAFAALVEEAQKAQLGGSSSPDSPHASSHTHTHTSPLITPHPPIIRDDRPVSHIHYRNPAESVPLARSLWLPRDPLKPVDLGDTVDYTGRALVSSVGGRGVIGSWEENPSRDEETFLGEPKEPAEGAEEQPAEEGEAPARGSDDLLLTPAPPPPRELVRRGSRLSIISNGGAAYSLTGNEVIRVAPDVAARIEAEQGGRQLTTLDDDLQRRGSVMSSNRASSILTSLQRRGTRASSTGDRPSSFFAHSPQHSPVLVRHPDEARPSPPAIPVFTDEPSPLQPSTTPKSAPPTESAFPFPPPSSSPTVTRRNTTASLAPPTSPQLSRARSPSDLSTGSSPHRLSSPSISASPASARFPPTSPTAHRTRQLRSPSLVPSLNFSATLARTAEEEGAGAIEVLVHPDIVDRATGAPAVSLSQAAALRAELLEEERRAHEEHARREASRREQEERDREGGGGSGWLRRLLVKADAAEEADET
ncbi:hypothetical protein JCM10207_007396 [Rhodosporidiobolus poonsookiae]